MLRWRRCSAPDAALDPTADAAHTGQGIALLAVAPAGVVVGRERRAAWRRLSPMWRWTSVRRPSFGVADAVGCVVCVGMSASGGC